jgi:HME family heavy-metal exporter
VTFAAAIKRGDAGFEGKPAVILGIQKQPTADTIALTVHRGRAGRVEGLAAGRHGGAARDLPPGQLHRGLDHHAAGQADRRLGLRGGDPVLLPGHLRPTIIALTAIPVSIFITALVFKYFGLSINTMTLGGLAIAIGGLVDDAVVGVENVLRRLKEDRAKHPTPDAPDRGGRPRHDGGALGHPVRHGHHRAGLHAAVRAAGLEGKLFVPLGIAFIVSTLASLMVSVTVTPVLSFYLLPRMKNLDHGDTKVLAWLKARYRSSLQACWTGPRPPWRRPAAAVLVAAAAVPFFPTTFLPPFNEGTLLIGLRLNPGVTLAESSRWRARPRCWSSRCRR